jgi:hypothetical protein
MPAEDVRPVDGPYHKRRKPALYRHQPTAAHCPREGRTLLTVIPCPACGIPAEVTERFSLPSTEGPVGHVALSCAVGHHFRMAVDRLPATTPVEAEAAQPVAAAVTHD